VFALYGKKTLLMGFDLRKPKIFEDFGLTNTEGISSFLANKSPLEQVIKPSGIDHLDILMAGPCFRNLDDGEGRRELKIKNYELRKRGFGGLNT
jgi:Mrp family chromosome partitioning ATPase